MDSKVYLEWRAKLRKWSSNTGGKFKRNSTRRRRGMNGCERISRITGKKGRGFKSGKTPPVARKWASGCKATVAADQQILERIPVYSFGCGYTVSLMPSRKPSPKHPTRRGLSSTRTYTTRASGDLRLLQVPAFSKLPWLIHAFSTSPGGISPLENEKVLNLGFTDWDTRENVLENRRRFQAAAGAPISRSSP